MDMLTDMERDEREREKKTNIKYRKRWFSLCRDRFFFAMQL